MRISKLKDDALSKFNSLLYSSKKRIRAIIGWLKGSSAIVGVALVTYGYGFDLHEEEKMEQIFLAIDLVFVIFVLGFVIRLLYAFRRITFVKERPFELFLVCFIIINACSNYLFGNLILEQVFETLGFNDYNSFYFGFVSFFMVLIVGYDTIKASRKISSLRLKPATTFILSFLLLISLGTGFLMLPSMTAEKGSLSFLDALFTSTSASCVTGLIVVDTATCFTVKGQTIIMILIQLGGLGIVSFATFFAAFLRQGVSIKQQLMVQNYLHDESLFSSKGTLKKIVNITLILELFTFIAIYFTWGEATFESTAQKIFFTAFHTISSFCNAGFSLYSSNLADSVVRSSYILHIVIAISIILGGVGFTVIDDLFNPAKLRTRLRNPWREWRISTKIAVFTSVVLLFLGTVSFLILEKNHALYDQNIAESLITSFFQSASARTAGFNTIDIGELRQPTLIVIIFLMFIGASSGSMGGGVKTSTFYLIIASVAATLRGQQRIEIGQRSIPKGLLFKALSIFFFAASLNLIGIFILSITEPQIALVDLAFEEISAFGTVGYSTGITASLSLESRIVIIISMFLGRVGTLTFAIALSNRTTTSRYKYPRAHLMVG